MTSWVGVFCLALAFSAALAAAAGSLLAAVGPPARGRGLPGVSRGAALACLLAAAGAALAVEWALVTHDFSVRFVAENGSRATSTYYTVTSLWAAHDGSLLLWALVLAGYLAWLARRRQDGPVHRWATAVVAGVTAFFLGLALFGGAVFDRVSPVPADGPGPTPLLQDHPAMGIHPPLLYVGLVGMVLPFGHAVGALATGRTGREWLEASLGPLRVAWTALTAGIVLGAWWSYAVLGWGGYWAWDPIENASLLPWLAATALLHAAMVQRRTGGLRAWTLGLAISTFVLAALTVFLTRSGMAASVHAFADSGVGPVLLGFLAAVVGSLLVLAGLRGAIPAPPPPATPLLSRGGALLVNNVLLVALLVTVLLGTMLPLLVEAATGDVVSVGPPYYNRMAGPLLLLLLLLMAIGPVLSWRAEGPRTLVARLAAPVAASAATVTVVALLFPGPLLAPVGFGLATLVVVCTVGPTVAEGRRLGGRRLVRRRATLGGRLAHLGVAVAAVGIVASSSYGTVGERTLLVGEPTSVGDLELTLLGTGRQRTDGVMATSATIRVDDGERWTVHPELRFYPARSTTVAAPAITGSPARDVYVTLLAVDQEEDTKATVRVATEPLVAWLWVGGGLVVMGGALATSGPRRRARSSPPTEQASGGPTALTTAGDPL